MTTPAVETVVEVTHPLVRHKLGLLRDADTPTQVFRQLVNELTLLLTYEATKDLATEEVDIETPLEHPTVQRISGKKVAVCPILRAGMVNANGREQAAFWLVIDSSDQSQSQIVPMNDWISSRNAGLGSEPRLRMLRRSMSGQNRSPTNMCVVRLEDVLSTYDVQGAIAQKFDFEEGTRRLASLRIPGRCRACRPAAAGRARSSGG
jgi:hypothetical protein